MRVASFGGRLDFELEPEVRDWLDSLSDHDFKRVVEVCGMLAEKSLELGPWSDHLQGAVWEVRIQAKCCGEDHVLVYCWWQDRAPDRAAPCGSSPTQR